VFWCIISVMKQTGFTHHNLNTNEDRQLDFVEPEKGTPFILKFMCLIAVLLIVSPIFMPSLGLLMSGAPQYFGESGPFIFLFGSLIGIYTVPAGILLLILSLFIIWLRN